MTAVCKTHTTFVSIDNSTCSKLEQSYVMSSVLYQINWNLIYACLVMVSMEQCHHLLEISCNSFPFFLTVKTGPHCWLKIRIVIISPVLIQTWSVIYACFIVVSREHCYHLLKILCNSFTVSLCRICSLRSLGTEGNIAWIGLLNHLCGVSFANSWKKSAKWLFLGGLSSIT